MVRKRDAQGLSSSSKRRGQDRSNTRPSRTARDTSPPRGDSASQSARSVRGGRTASEGRSSRVGGETGSSRDSRLQESSIRSRRDTRYGSQARTSARPSRREPELDSAQESRDAARQRLQARTATTQQERSLFSDSAQRSSQRPARAETLMRTARRTAVTNDEPPQEAASPATNTRARRGAAQSSRSARTEGKRRSQANQTNNMLGGEQGIPHNVLKNPMKPTGGKRSDSSGRTGAFARFAGGCSWLWSKSKALSVALVVLVVIVVAGGVDSLATMNRIYQGVSVGNIDLSGKTPEEATTLISQEYEPRFNSNAVVFCANEQAAQRSEEEQQRNESLEEQISYEESLSSRDRWTVNASLIGATFDPSAYAKAAYEVGRSDGGFFARLAAQFSGHDIKPTCTFNETSLEALRDEIIDALGSKMVNFNIEMKDAHAQVTDGHDGYEVSEEWLIDRLNQALLEAEGESRFIIDMHDVVIQIDHDKAQTCADEINASIPCGVNFSYDDKSYFADKNVLAEWIKTEVKQEGDAFALVPFFDGAKANQKIIQGFGFSYGGSDYLVHFANEGGNVTVSTNATGSVPQVSEAIAHLNETFFSSSEKTTAAEVQVVSAQIPESMSFEEALDYGLITEISSYTTRYASGAEARNNNIHVAADALNNSICKAGETWSFLALAGEATPEKGYQGAGAIIGGEYSDAIGGGICQVATTVFNVVYEAGYSIERRNNHSLYIASYPEGRDAAIAYPDIDLVWRNDTESDVLLRMSYTNSSVSATLYGVDPGYEVTTVYGEWEEGEPYRTVVRKDPDYPLGTEFIESSGANGRSITVVRTVKDRNGNIIQEKEFHSNYQPKNEVKVQGSAEPSSE